MSDLRAAAKKRAQRRASAPAREPGDMGEKPDHEQVVQYNPDMYMGSNPETIRRQHSTVTIHVNHGEPDKDETADGMDDPADDLPPGQATADGVAALREKLQAAAKKRATRRTAR